MFIFRHPKSSIMTSKFSIPLNTESKFIFSTSGSYSSIEKYNTAFDRLGLNLVYFTFPDNITAETYAGLLKSPICRGGAVTGKGGLKTNIIPFLDEVEILAKETLAVNTVVNKGGKLYGYNTDTFGLKVALERGLKTFSTQVKTAAIYGNGGVSGVAFKVLQDLGIQTTIIGRDPQKVLAKRKELGIEQIPHFEGPYDLIVDATPISSSPDFLKATAFENLLQGCKMIFCHNMPEKDGKTNYLLEYCQQQDIPYIPGKWMYQAQLIKQYSLFFEGLTHTDGIHPISEEDIIEAWQLEK